MALGSMGGQGGGQGGSGSQISSSTITSITTAVIAAALAAYLGISHTWTAENTFTAALTPPAPPDITQGGTPGSTAYSYKVVAVLANGMQAVSAAGSTATGNATLDITNYNTVTWSAYTGAVQYIVYRTADGRAAPDPGLIYPTTTNTTINDTGLQASSGPPTAPPATGGGLVTADLQRIGAYADDPKARLGVVGDVSVRGAIRATAQDNFSTGYGVELQYVPPIPATAADGAGIIIAYDRNESGYRPLALNYGADAHGPVLVGSGAARDEVNQFIVAGGIAQDAVMVTGYVCEGRLTLTTGTPVTTADVATSTDVFFAPHNGNRVTLYNGTRWKLYAFTQRTLALGELTANKNYDVFLYDNAGTLTLELSAAWNSDTARTDAITTQDGVLCKTGALTRRYLGTIRTISTTQATDSARQRFVFNYYNRVERTLALYGAATWTDNAATYKAANSGNADGANHSAVEWVSGWSDAPVRAQLDVAGQDTLQAVWRSSTVALGLDSTSASSGIVSPAITIAASSHQGGVSYTRYGASYVGFPGLGYHALNWLESTEAFTTMTWYGAVTFAGNDNVEVKSGITGVIRQ